MSYDLRRVTGTNDGNVTNSQFVDTVVAEQDDFVFFDTESLEAIDTESLASTAVIYFTS